MPRPTNCSPPIAIRGLCLAVLFGTVLLATLANVAQAADDTKLVPTTSAKVDFARELQPLLAKRCFACHGPDKAESGLRLNERATAIAAAESGAHAIVPGKPEESELLRRIASNDPDERMPPEGERLTAEQVDTFRRWIADGADWEKHWAFEPRLAVEPPAVQNAGWVRNPIDAFILSKLESVGLKPAAPADKVALLRRATYDLTGLPPTPQEVDAFVADNSPGAFEKVIDRLLKSPHYGERWGRHWLDLVRYAETNSFERDNPKPHVWRYRDYVIRSFNDDKPYDQFLREQLAGDEQPEPTADSITATGFYRLGLWDDEPADRLLAKFDGLDDIVATTGQVFLGLTVNCARCHDHKIDPLPQTDYYGLVAFFHNITPMAGGGPGIETPIFPEGNREKHEAAVQALQQRRDALQTAVTQFETDFQRLYEASAKTRVALTDIDGLEYRFYRDSWDRLPDFDNLKAETVAKLPNGLFDIRPATRRTDFGFVFVGELIVPRDGEYTFFLDSDDGSRLFVGGEKLIEYDGIHGTGNERQASVKLQSGRRPIRLEYFQRRSGLGLSVAWSGPGFTRRALSTGNGEEPGGKTEVARLIEQHGAELLGEQRVAKYGETVAALEQAKKETVPTAFALAVTENGRQAPPTFVLGRGNPRSPGAEVPPAFPKVLDATLPKLPEPAADAKTSGRRTVLANWLASPQNPLTARVIANRIWQHHFGRGIVRSSNNFGNNGVPPTHPELLDWLANDLVAGGWRMKSLHKRIMLSNTYQMSSQASDEGLAQDPINDWFWRFDMRRLSAEEIRDSILAVNGRLNSAMYGPSVYSEISAEVLAGQSRPGSGWGRSSPEEQARRAIYIHVKRSLPEPLLAAFDLADPDSSCEARFVTTQPAQALAMLNGKFLHEQAAAFAARLRKEAGAEPAAQVALALRLACSRPPTQAQIDRGLELLESLQANHAVDADRALDLFCLVVFNLNEFVYLD